MIWGNGKLWETVETDFLDFFVLSKLDSCFNNCDSISMSMSQIQLAESGLSGSVTSYCPYARGEASLGQ